MSGEQEDIDLDAILDGLLPTSTSSSSAPPAVAPDEDMEGKDLEEIVDFILAKGCHPFLEIPTSLASSAASSSAAVSLPPSSASSPLPAAPPGSTPPLPPPSPSAAPQSYTSPPCFACGSPSLRTCTGCRSAFYCSPACQKTDWPSHRTPCAQSPIGIASRSVFKAISVADVGESASSFLTAVDGFNELKNDFDHVAVKHNLSRTDRFKSFGPPELIQEQRTLKELFDAAAATKPVFDAMIRSAVLKVGLDPDEQYDFPDDEEPENGAKRRCFFAHDAAPLKGEPRCVEKVANEYGGLCSRLVDVVRCTVVCMNADEIVSLMEVMTTLHPVRLKNRFATGCEMKTGYRDCNYSVSVTGRNGVKHICEVQVHLAAVLALKGKQHVFYEYFREYFKGGREAYEARMELLRSFGGQKGDGPKQSINERIVKIVNGNDVDSLEGLEAMCGKEMMGNYKLLVHVNRKLLAIEEGKEQRDESAVLGRLNELGVAMTNAGDLDGALPLMRRALTAHEQTLGIKHPSTLVSVNNLAMLLQAQGKLDEALPLCRRALAAREQTLGEDNPDTLSSVNNLATLLYFQGKLDEAAPLLRRAVETSERTLGIKHPSTLSSVNNLAMLLRAQGKLDEALPLLRRALTAQEQTLGGNHPGTLVSVNNLATLLQAQGNVDEALPLLRRALTAQERTLGFRHPSTLVSVNSLAGLLSCSKGKQDEGLSLFRRAVTGREQTLGEDHPDTISSVISLALLLKSRKKLDEALPLFRRAVETRERTLGKDHKSTIFARKELDLLLKK